MLLSQEPDPDVICPAAERSRVAAVIIGRNEHGRLAAALQSVANCGIANAVYVDSASVDDSVSIAEGCGVQVHGLDPSRPMSAARGRNEGWAIVRSACPTPEFVLFLDGDSEIDADWVREAEQLLVSTELVGAVCGRGVEVNPNRNAFHRISAVEWTLGGTGSIGTFGGNALLRAWLVDDLGGYDESLTVGEDPDLSRRIVDRGFSIIGLDRVAYVHDIDMALARQWWKRAERSGQLLADRGIARRSQGKAMLHSELAKALGFGIGFPLAVLATRGPVRRLVLGCYALRTVLAFRSAFRSARPEFFDLRTRVTWGVSCLMSPLPHAIGALRTMIRRWKYGRWK